MISVFWIRMLQCFLLISLMACQQQQQQEHPSPPLLEIGQRQLTLKQFDRELQLNYPDITSLPADKQLQLKEQLIKQLTDRELILGEAARLNIQISPDELDVALAEVRGSYSADEFDQILKQTGKTFEAWIAALKLRLLTAKVSATILSPQIKVTGQETEQYYLANKEEFRRPLEISARQMLFSSREEALKVLQLLKEGGDFATLAREYSLSPDSENGGALENFSKGQLPAEFDAVLFKLPVRQVSDPIESPYGFHLFIVEKRRSAGLRPYAAVKDEIAEKLYQEKEESAFHLWLENLQKTTKTIVHWELLQPK